MKEKSGGIKSGGGGVCLWYIDFKILNLDLKKILEDMIVFGWF